MHANFEPFGPRASVAVRALHMLAELMHGANRQEGKPLMSMKCNLTYLDYAKHASCRCSSASRGSHQLLLRVPARKLFAVRHFDE